VPTVADLRTRRLDLTRAALRESLLGDDLDRFRVVVETLTDEFDLMEVALAAVKLAHEATGGPVDEDEIPEPPAPREHREPRAPRDGGARRAGGDGGTRGRAPAAGRARLFVSLGRAGGVRPQDLVGAITGETRLSGRDIGAIEITDRFSLVEVPDDAADEVIGALQSSRVKGRRVTVRHDRAH
jgi:ATP-dependent RNA helicase DeaD